MNTRRTRLTTARGTSFTRVRFSKRHAMKCSREKPIVKPQERHEWDPKKNIPKTLTGLVGFAHLFAGAANTCLVRETTDDGIDKRTCLTFVTPALFPHRHARSSLSRSSQPPRPRRPLCYCSKPTCVPTSRVMTSHPSCRPSERLSSVWQRIAPVWSPDSCRHLCRQPRSR